MIVTVNTYTDLDFILSAQYEVVNGYDFYRYIFPNNESTGEINKDFSKPNAIYLYQDEFNTGKKRGLRRRVMLNDTWATDYINYVENNLLTLCSGLSYRNRLNKIAHAQQMNALIFDLDGVGEDELKTLFLRFEKSSDVIRSLPIPTFIVLSGTGLHLYYVFEQPIDLYPNIKIQLKSLKYDLTFKMWDYKSTSTEKQIQYQSVNQGFRMVGSINNKYNLPVKAYRMGEKVTLDYINQYVIQKENKVDINRPFKPSKITLAVAKENYSEWYQRVVVEKQKRLKKWDIKGKQGYALYEWWIRQAESIQGGHRYYFLMCLAIYACKCDVPKSKLKEDMQAIFHQLKNVEHTNPLEKEDIESALEAYDKEYYNFTIADIEKLTNVRIEKNKRNGRTQDEHLKRARAVQEIDYPNGEWRVGNGRPSAAQIVTEYQKKNPPARKVDCIRDTGLSKKTVYKYFSAVGGCEGVME